MNGIWCKKIGMTQLFRDSGELTAVTVFDTAHWIVTQIKGSSVQVGLPRDKFLSEKFSPEWLKSMKLHFSFVREIVLGDVASELAVGMRIDVASILSQGDYVDVSGLTIGRGFQGGVKRHGFKGGRASHGDKLGRKPGSMGFMRSRGRVIKGWRMAGHMGVEKRTVRRLEVVAAAAEAYGKDTVVIKGSVPGKVGSLLFIRKA